MAYITRTWLVSTLLVCATLQFAHSGDTMYVSSKQANIYRAASLDSEVLKVLARRDEVEVVTEKGIWFQVKVPVTSGWLSRYSISPSPPPENKVSIFGRLKNFFREDNKRARLTLVSTAGGLRNLTEEESDAIGKTDFAALQSVESILISETQLQKFIEEASN